MNFEEWEPYYHEILDYFGFDRKRDEEAASLLASLIRRDNLDELTRICRHQTITVCGNAPCLADEIPLIRGAVLAADAASEVLMQRGILPSAVFTDLDGATEQYLTMNEAGTVMVIHAHGDNMPLLRFWVPQFVGPVVATTQAAPFGHVYNFGGFTDGDRAVFAADALGASSVAIIGFDPDDPGVDPVKKGKLFWARRLLALLGYEC